ncbi:MAG: winged helix-turn-helix transcriptional regulator [Bacteriovoracaceae bacterium]|nr:winged helix-turn-helix transcriptional regulator [Bacteriovoracaceae bacterium]
MRKVSSIGSLLKKIYRTYSQQILLSLQQKGFTDLRPSFLEVMLFICENDSSSIKEIGIGCNLKKQTMTSHLNELKKRGYIFSKINENDRREQKVFLTEYGEKFKFNLFESINELEKKYVEVLGEVELDRINHLLTNFHDRLLGSEFFK